MSTVLVLDDRAADRELMRTVLGYAGHDVIEAATARDALQVARRERPDLIITDILMPDTSGYEFVRDLRTDEHIGLTKVIFCTATYAEAELRRLADACGVAHILVKPCEPEEIVRVVGEVLGSTGRLTAPARPSEETDREQLRVVNAKLLEKVDELERASARQRQLHDELARAERRTAESLTLLETLLSAAPIGVAFVDQELRLVRINAALSRASGLAVDDALGRPVAELAPDSWGDVEPLYRQVLQEGKPVVNQELARPGPDAGGEVAYSLTSYYPVRLEGEVIGVGVVTVDITERRQADEFRSVVMQTMAEGLFVTDAEDRLLMMNAAASKLLGWSEDELRGRRVHDTIHFQQENGLPVDEAGSERLTAIAEGRTVRVGDDAFTRRDGAIVPVAYSAAPLSTGGGARGGVVVFRDTTAEKAEQVRARRELASLAWVGRIQDALDDDRLLLYQQPIVPLNGGSESAELLVRMLGPRGELVLPARFLPIAEKYRLIGDIDRWVLREGLRYAAGGRHVSINLSAESVTSGTLVATIDRELRESGVEPGNVVFELTETALMSDLEVAAACTRDLAELGCGVAIDDFGTGYGSFTYLQKLPITQLKIDVDFVRDLVSSQANQHVVKAIVSLAAGFGQVTVAEGIEDPEALTLLKEYGVDFAQGFHLGAPQPLE